MRSPPLTIISFIMLIAGFGCSTSVDRHSSSEHSEPEAIMLAILQHLFAEQAATVAWNEKCDAISASDDPFAPPSPKLLVALPPRPTMPASPSLRFCVHIFDKDPSAEFFRLAATEHLLPGSSFRKHPNSFASAKEGIAYEYGNMPELVSLETIKHRWFAAQPLSASHSTATNRMRRDGNTR